ncbi:hypothetical protein [Kribbella sp.]|uniref:hypothetical protein n=1 Tax=Kribbella sp. TaxID=1871183 RepID=UPI002D76F045|nr:hypothetical protein [Kribbella sp.]
MRWRRGRLRASSRRGNCADRWPANSSTPTSPDASRWRSAAPPTTSDPAAARNLGDRVFPAGLAGKTATVLGDPDQPHTYTYIPDIGEALAVLGEHPDATGQVWHIPNAPDTRSA